MVVTVSRWHGRHSVCSDQNSQNSFAGDRSGNSSREPLLSWLAQIRTLCLRFRIDDPLPKAKMVASKSTILITMIYQRSSLQYRLLTTKREVAPSTSFGLHGVPHRCCTCRMNTGRDKWFEMLHQVILDPQCHGFIVCPSLEELQCLFQVSLVYNDELAARPRDQRSRQQAVQL